MRSEDSSSGESEEKEEAGWKCLKIYHTLLSPPLSCKYPTVLVGTYSSCTLHIFAWSSLSIIRRHNNYSFLYFTFPFMQNYSFYSPSILPIIIL